ncbi:hypothetical protein C8Q70DRAFT_141402 [Cubamyces menziesii]|nr:hypothetical protein C8Q70DRAFT_141402 [Cubamyces menziesii]
MRVADSGRHASRRRQGFDWWRHARGAKEDAIAPEHRTCIPRETDARKAGRSGSRLRGCWLARTAGWEGMRRQTAGGGGRCKGRIYSLTPLTRSQTRRASKLCAEEELERPRAVFRILCVRRWMNIRGERGWLAEAQQPENGRAIRAVRPAEGPRPGECWERGGRVAGETVGKRLGRAIGQKGRRVW